MDLIKLYDLRNLEKAQKEIEMLRRENDILKDTLREVVKENQAFKAGGQILIKKKKSLPRNQNNKSSYRPPESLKEFMQNDQWWVKNPDL